MVHKHVPSVPVTLEQLSAIARRSAAVVGEVRRRSLAPNSKKEQPTFSTSQVAEVLGKSLDWMEYRIKRGEEPKPEKIGSRLTFSLPTLQAWSRKHRAHMMRPEGQKALTIAVGNFKGGSSKTTIAAALPQGLSLRGHRVLLLDVDPQGSASSLYGILPSVDKFQTLREVFTGALDSVESLIQPTYWGGIDIIPAANILSEAETALPGQPRFWESLGKALEPVRDRYDAIIIDTSPVLSPLTATCFMAADAVVMPVTPNGLDFASSAEFFKMFSDMCVAFREKEPFVEKEFEFFRVVLSRVDSADRSNVYLVRELMQAGYGELIAPVEIPKSSIVTGASSSLMSIYDAQKYATSRSTFQRVKAPFDQLVENIEQSMCHAWARRELLQKSKE